MFMPYAFWLAPMTCFELERLASKLLRGFFDELTRVLPAIERAPIEA